MLLLVRFCYHWLGICALSAFSHHFPHHTTPPTTEVSGVGAPVASSEEGHSNAAGDSASMTNKTVTIASAGVSTPPSTSAASAKLSSPRAEASPASNVPQGTFATQAVLNPLIHPLGLFLVLRFFFR